MVGQGSDGEQSLEEMPWLEINGAKQISLRIHFFLWEGIIITLEDGGMKKV